MMLIGARLNWLLSHGKGKTWGAPGTQKFIHVDIAPTEMDSNVEIAAPVVGDIASCVAVMLSRIGGDWPKPGRLERRASAPRSRRTSPRWRRACRTTTMPMDYHGALGALRDIIKERPDTILVNEGANTLDFARSIIDIYQPRKRLDVGTWGIMGIGMGYCGRRRRSRPASRCSPSCGDSAFGFSGMEIETICRYKLPVCVVVFNNNGIYRGTDINPGGTDPAWTTFVKDCALRPDGEGVRRRRRARHLARRAGARRQRGDRTRGKPTLINAIIDEKAGTESGRIGNLNPQSVVAKKA